MLKSAFWVFLCSCLLGSLHCKDQKQETVTRGENTILQCNNSRGAAVVMLKWRKPDLQSELENTNKQLYVLYIREKRAYDKYQLPSFQGRVQLRDPQMKDGDLSVIIKNVSLNDAGEYECYAGYGRQGVQLMSSTHLTVEEPGQRGGQSGDGENEDKAKEGGGDEGGSVGLIAGLSVSAVLLLVVGVVVFVIYRKHRNQSNPDYQPPAEQNMKCFQ